MADKKPKKTEHPEADEQPAREQSGQSAPKAAKQPAHKPSPDAALEALTAELAAARAEAEAQKKQAEAMTDHAKRMQADFENFRKRNADSIGKARTDGENAVIRDVLPALDVFDSALKMIADEQVAVGVRMIRRQLTDTLARYGVEEIPALGADFDPELHEAIERVACDDPAMSGKITEVLRQGFRRGDKVLRHSMVKVAD